MSSGWEYREFGRLEQKIADEKLLGGIGWVLLGLTWLVIIGRSVWRWLT